MSESVVLPSVSGDGPGERFAKMCSPGGEWYEDIQERRKRFAQPEGVHRELILGMVPKLQQRVSLGAFTREQAHQCLCGFRDKQAGNGEVTDLPSNDEIWQALFPQTDLTRETAEDIARQIATTGWFWSGWMPLGNVTLLFGEPDIGKNWFALDLVRAVVDEARTLPDGSVSAKGLALWIDLESFAAGNVARMETWGIDRTRVLYPMGENNGGLDPRNPEDREEIERLAQSPDVRLMIVDSLGAAFTRENEADIKDFVRWLASLAQETNLPIVLIHHPRKPGPMDGKGLTLHSIRGHSGIAQFVRSVIGIECPDPAMPDHRRVSCLKSNLCLAPEPFGFTLEDTSNGVEIAYSAAPEAHREEGPRAMAVNFLQLSLQDGPRAVQELYREADGSGLSRRTLTRAKDNLRVTSVRRNGVWFWSLPGREVE